MRMLAAFRGLRNQTTTLFYSRDLTCVAGRDKLAFEFVVVLLRTVEDRSYLLGD